MSWKLLTADDSWTSAIATAVNVINRKTTITIKKLIWINIVIVIAAVASIALTVIILIIILIKTARNSVIVLIKLNQEWSKWSKFTKLIRKAKKYVQCYINETDIRSIKYYRRIREQSRNY